MKQGQGLQKIERGVRVLEKGLGMEAERSAELAQIAVATAAKASIEAAFVMALKRPREEEVALEKILSACGNFEFASKARYKKPIGNTAIEGPSIRFAEEMLRVWGNIKVQQMVIYEDDQKRVIKVMVIDLETNMSIEREVVIEKIVERRDPKGREAVGERINSTGVKVFIVKATEDEIQIKQGALVSKAMRNEGLRLIPQHIVERAMAAAIETVRGGIKKNPQVAKKTIVEYFADLHITADQLGTYLGCPIFKATPEQIAELRTIYATIKDGQSTWDDYEKKGSKAKGKTNGGVLDDLVPGDTK